MGEAQRVGNCRRSPAQFQGNRRLPRLPAWPQNSDAYLAPGRAMATFGYGYLLWLLPGNRRQFALVGDYGQRICIDPASKLVMVQTALEDHDEVWRLWSTLVEQFGQG
jgi:CubicO group peptidase (beta-lactamase class C family)